MRTLQSTLHQTTATIAQHPAPLADLHLRALLQNSLGNVYTLERELSGAGMARVFVAEESALGRKVVLKIVPREWAQDTDGQQLHGEIKLSASLQQANIIPVLSAGVAAGWAYYTMPLVEERSLVDLLNGEGPLSVGRAVSLLRDVARALAYAHAHGVVHRDIKPGNILLSGGSAIVADFGIARAITGRPSGATLASGVVSGTPEYMAPEQATGDALADHRVDIYAFGCLAYAVFTGKPPFADRSALETIVAHLTASPTPLAVLRPDIPTRIATLIARCLEKDPGKRPQSASDLLEQLDAVDQPAVMPASQRWSTVVLGMSVVAAVAALLGMAH